MSLTELCENWVNSLTLVIHSYSMNLFLPAGLMRIKFNIYNDCIEDNCIKGRTRLTMSDHHIKHALLFYLHTTRITYFVFLVILNFIIKVRVNTKQACNTS